MGIAGVVEGRAARHLEGERAAHNGYLAHNMMLVLKLLTMLDGHEVGDLGHAIDSKEACNEDICIGQVKLFMAHTWRIGRRDTEEAAFVCVRMAPKTLGESKHGRQHQS